jgi:nitrate/TMAO reductase-like tetraheme cytochrome c subunit
MAATCGKCHQGIREKFESGVHGAALKAGKPGPVCADCHTAHSIRRTDTERWRLDAAQECGTCHARVVESFERTFHGKVTQLGFTRVATCADCHAAHDILPAANPASTVSRERLVATCGRCHPGANERFVQYDPHPNPKNYSRGKVLWFINQFYTVAIAGCFGFFALHSGLWYNRERIERKQKGTES